MDQAGVWGGCDNQNPLFEILEESKKISLEKSWRRKGKGKGM